MIIDSSAEQMNLKNFWPKWKFDSYKFLILKCGINDSVKSEEIFTEIFKTNNKYETQAACIYLSKINDLIQAKVN